MIGQKTLPHGKGRKQLLLAAFCMDQSSCTLSFHKKKFPVAQLQVIVSSLRCSFLTTAGDGMDEWSIEQVQDFVTAEFGSEIAQNFNPLIPEVFHMRLVLAYTYL